MVRSIGRAAWSSDPMNDNCVLAWACLGLALLLGLLYVTWLVVHL